LCNPLVKLMKRLGLVSVICCVVHSVHIH
jgi:hypothetical protein